MFSVLPRVCVFLYNVYFTLLKADYANMYKVWNDLVGHDLKYSIFDERKETLIEFGNI